MSGHHDLHIVGDMTFRSDVIVMENLAHSDGISLRICASFQSVYSPWATRTASINKAVPLTIRLPKMVRIVFSPKTVKRHSNLETR